MATAIDVPYQSPRPPLAPRIRVPWELAVALPILIGLVALASLAPALFPDPNAIALEHRLKPPRWLAGGGAGWLGTDSVGRDILARVAHGARVSLLVAVSSVLTAAAAGITVGVTAGYFRGLFDQTAMGIVDIQLSLPFMLIAIFLAAVLGAKTQNTILILAITGWASYARIIRGEVLQVRELEFVEASRATGASDWHTIRRSILPNIMGSAVVVASIAVPRIILAEASLSFIGLGIQPPTPSWGTMIAESRNYLNIAWWTASFPGFAITLTVLSMTLLGNWLRDRLDPRASRGGRGRRLATLEPAAKR